MSEKAFPQTVLRNQMAITGSREVAVETLGGMTLRDYFAAKALQGGMSQFYNAGEAWTDYDDFARSCYNVADAMLREREQ